MAAATCTLCPLKSSVVCTFRPAPSQGLVCTVRVGVVRIRCGDGEIRVVSEGAPKQQQQHLGVVEQLAADLASTSSTSVDFRERMRRERISHSNKGKVPWNKGRRHSPETIAKIKERTKLAMLNPEIRDKLRQCGKNQSKETKAKIRSKMVGFWESKRAMKQAQLVCVREWKEAVAEAARVGYCAGDEEYRWDSYKRIKEQYRLEDVEAGRREREALRARVKEERAIRKKKPISDAHRKAISDAIRAKWADPAYQARVSAGMAKIDAERRQRRVDEKRVRVVVAGPKRELGVKRKAAVRKTPATVAAAVVEEVHPVEKRRPVQVDEDFIAEVLAEEVTLKTKSERSTAARIKGPRKVTLVSLEDHKKTDEVEDTPSLRPEDVQLSSKLTSQSYKDPFVLEKVQRIQQLRKGRLEVELKRKEAADRARMLIADAERAASALEQSGKTDAATMGKLMETRKLLAEATRAMQATEMKQQQQQQGASANFQPGSSSRSRNSNENEELLSLSTGGDFHSRIRPYPSGDNLADCPHPIPIRIGGMRPSEHQRRGNGNGRPRSTSIRATLKDETQATDTEDCQGN